MRIPIESRPTRVRRLLRFVGRRWRWVVVLVLLMVGRLGWCALSGQTLPEVLWARAVVLSFAPDHGGLPLYELRVSASDLGKLVPPAHDRDRSYASIEVRLRDGEEPSEWGDGRLRLRGSIQPEAGPKRSFRLVMPDGRAVNLLSADIKDSHVVPFEMWVAERLGCRVPRCRFVRLRFNEVDWGVYVEVEQWGRSMLERWGLEDADLYGESLEPELVSQFDKGASGYRKYDPQPGRERDFAALHALYQLVEQADDATFERQIFAVLDKESALAWAVHMALLNSYHQYWGVGYRLLANPVSGKIEILPWDAIPALHPRIVPGVSSPQLMPATNVLVNRLLNHPEFLRAYSQKLVAAIGELEEQVPGFLADTYLHPDVLAAARRDQVQGDYPVVVHAPHEQLLLALTGERWPLLIGLMHQQVVEVWDQLFAISAHAQLGVASPVERGPTRRVVFRLSYDGQVAGALTQIRLALVDGAPAPEGPVRADVQLTAVASTSRIRYRGHRRDPPERVRGWSGTAEVHSGYLTLTEIDLPLGPRFPELQLAGMNMDRAEQHSAFVRRRPYTLEIRLDRALSLDGRAHEVSAVNLARNAPVRTKLTTYDPGSSVRRLRDPAALARDHAWLRWDAARGALVVTESEVTLTRDLVVPEGATLVVAAGTTLRMGPGVSLLSFGPLEWRGTAEQPVRVVGVDGGRWGAIGVVEAPGSVMTHVVVQGASAARVAEVGLRAAISFHLAPPATVEACRGEAPGLTSVVVVGREGARFVRTEVR